VEQQRARWLAAGGEAKEIAGFRERNGRGFVIWSKKSNLPPTWKLHFVEFLCYTQGIWAQVFTKEKLPPHRDILYRIIGRFCLHKYINTHIYNMGQAALIFLNK
jgi:hypothetical protein